MRDERAFPFPFVRRAFKGSSRSVTTAPPAAELVALTKSFGAIAVLRSVSLALQPGEVHVLAGANGAGKSTLIKVLAGAIDDFTGELRVGGRAVRFRDPSEARAAGVATIHQELSLVGAMSVVDNLFLGRRGGAFVARAEERKVARRVLAELGLEAFVDRPVEELPIALQQLLEIGKALLDEARVMVMDEPTSALDGRECERLFSRIHALQARGVAVLYVTHRTEEIFRLATRITALRDGSVAGSARVAEVTRPLLLSWMLGERLAEEELAPQRHASREAQDVVLDVRGLSVPARRHATSSSGAEERLEVRDASFCVRRGEVVGLAGLHGAGTTALLHALFGALEAAQQRGVRAAITLCGRPFVPRGPSDSVARGLALLTADRKGSGVVAPMSIRANATLASARRFSRLGVMRRGLERIAVSELATRMRLRTSGQRGAAPSDDAALEAPIAELSGGNQQKVLLARCLLCAPKLLLLDEPTRGVDVGAKADLHALLRQAADEGTAIVLATAELADLLALCDRIVVLHRGAVVDTLDRGEAMARGGAQRILAAAMGESQRPADRAEALS